MKKIIVLTALFALVSAGSALAGEATIATGGSTVIGGQSFAVSNNVSIGIISSTTAYTTISRHTSGDREFGTNSTAPKIYWQEAASSRTAVTSVTAPAVSGWTAL